MVILIAHRGNTNGPDPSRENSPEYIDLAIHNGFDVEIDVWGVDGRLWLGHDGPQYQIDVQFLKDRSSKLWCHAKNLEALKFLVKNGFHVFSHENDDYILTSKGYIWAYPGKPVDEDVICVMPERGGYATRCLGICSDFVAQIEF